MNAVKIIVAVTVAALLSGCIVVPGRYHGAGYYGGGGYQGGGYYGGPRYRGDGRHGR